MLYYFVMEDFNALEAKLEHLNAEVRRIGEDMGRSCGEGAETYHDNFAFEDGERQQRMLARRIAALLPIRRGARIVRASSDSSRVVIGSVVSFEDHHTGKEHRLRLGSYMLFDDDRAISYGSPIGRALLGAEEGEIVEARIDGKLHELEVGRIEASGEPAAELSRSA